VLTQHADAALEQSETVEHVVVVETERGLSGCDVELVGEDAESFAPAVTEALAKEGLGAPIFERQSLWPVSAMHIFEEWWKRSHEQVERDVPADGMPFRRPVPITFQEPEKSFSVQTELGPRPVAAVGLQVEITRTQRLVAASRVTRYSEDGGELADLVPTALYFLGIEPPLEMTGKLLVRDT